MIEQCPKANQECKYWDRRTPSPLRKKQDNGCFSDVDHIYPQRFAKDDLSEALVYSEFNQVQTCRSEHEDKTAKGDMEQLFPEEIATVMTGLKLATDLRRRVEELNGN
jgi:CRISPR/Cas system Type II protein with McrA/HNH and RuvC-like nuclease domain